MKKISRIFHYGLFNYSFIQKNISTLFVSPLNFFTLRSCSTSEFSKDKAKVGLIPLKHLSAEQLGHSIILRKGNGSNEATQIDYICRNIKIAKACSFGSSAFGLFFIPIFSSYIWEAATESAAMAGFLTLTNCFLCLLSFTPLLLHFLVKRFAVDVYYNNQTKIFTSVHYNLFLQRRALRFESKDIFDVTKNPKKNLFSLANCFIHSYPVLLILDESNCTDKDAFKILSQKTGQNSESITKDDDDW